MNRRSAGLGVTAALAASALGLAGTTSAGAATHPRAARGSEVPPTTLTGQKVGAQPETETPGTVLGDTFVAYPRLFGSHSTGLAIGGDSQGNEYAAITTDGGSTWKVASPALFTATADAPNSISSIAVDGTIDMIYGPECIDVSNNGGASWYRVYPDGFVTAVVPGLRGIAAYVQVTGDNNTVRSTDEYVSTNAGKSWKLENILGG